VNINLPVKFSWQIAKPFNMFIETRIASFHTNNPNGTSYIWESTPLKLGAKYAFHRSFDLFAEASVGEIQDAQNTAKGVLGINYRFGAIDG
jgi:hypothetical protein